MNIEKIKEFIFIRKDLYEAGVIGISVFEDEVHVKPSQLEKEDGLVFGHRDCEEYPYKVSITREGIKVYCILTKENLGKFFPQFLELINEEEEAV